MGLSLALPNGNARAAGPVAYASPGDYRSIQAALNSLPPTGGTVRIPAGIYYRNAYENGVAMDPIQLKSNQTLMPAEDVSEPNQCKLVALVPGNLIQSYDTENVAIYGLSLKAWRTRDDPDKLPADAICRGMALWGVQGATVANCYLGNFQNMPALSVAGEAPPSTREASDIIIRNCYVYGTINHSGISLYQLVYDSEVRDCTVEDCGYSGILLDNEVDYNVVDNNTVSRCGFNDVILPSGINRSYSGISVDNAAENRIWNNRVDACAKDGITLNVSGQSEDRFPEKCERNSVAFNTVTNCHLNGIRVQGLGDDQEVVTYAVQNQVYDNVCSHNASAGIRVSRGNGTTVVSNYLTGNNHPIVVEQSINSQVAGNVVWPWSPWLP